MNQYRKDSLRIVKQQQRLVAFCAYVQAGLLREEGVPQTDNVVCTDRNPCNPLR